MRGAIGLRPASTGAGKITHVVYIVQENRSFDDMFQGYPGADTVSSGKDSHGKTIALKPVSLKATYDLDHSEGAMVERLRRHRPTSRNAMQDGRIR